MNANEIAADCGFDSAWNMLKTNCETDELLDLLHELLHDDSQKGSDIMYDWIKEIASDKYEWVDWEQLQADADDARYDAWKDDQYEQFFGED